ncbi:MAG: DUF885 domain-containing protein [Actinobacteria bacterium]|nr:DUF885 domain-containing protein [Actinomycetota bacterium]
MTGSRPSAVFELADQYVAAVALLDPITATGLGVAGGERTLTDFSPEGSQAQAALAGSVLQQLDAIEASGALADDDRVAALSMRERLGSLLAMHEAGDELRRINVLASPPQEIRAVFDLMSYTEADQRQDIAVRMSAVPEALASWRRSLAAGVDAGIVASRRQALAVAGQCDTFGDRDAGWFSTRARQIADETGADVVSMLEAAGQAEAAYRESAEWLRDVYAPACDERDGVGAERYARMARAWNGAQLDLLDTYEWGWVELTRITARMESVADRLGVPLSEAKAFLDSSPEHTIAGEAALLEFLLALTERATEAMSETYFDIDPRVRTCEVKIAAHGSAAAPYYIPPSEDLARPGSTWYPTMGREVFPKWWLVSVWYHESVPGHHLQCSTVVLERERLSRFQRTLGWTSGYGEGWALYAERLMDELGFFADSGEEMGFLSAQAMRAVRVVVDIGLHLGLTVPPGQGELSGREIDHALAVGLLIDRALLDRAFAESEVDRYLGIPGQAISYKVGERFWLEARERAQSEAGDSFDLKAWHAYALRLGPLGLDPFRVEMERFPGS